MDFIKIFKSVFELFSIPMQSNFKVLQFSGLADGSSLTPSFNLNEVRGRTIVIKGIKFVPFYNEVTNTDISLTDGVTVNSEPIPQNFSIDRIFEYYVGTGFARLAINGKPVIFTPFDGVTNNGNCALNLELDNIYYKFPAAVETFEFFYDAFILNDITTATRSNPLLKVFIQCYII